jgi:hypothetical protein
MLIKSALRDLLSVSYVMISTTVISHLRWLSPLWCLTAPPFPRKRGHYKAPLCYELLMKGLLFKALLSHRSAGERWWRQPPKGDCIFSPAGRLYCFRCQRQHKKWRPKGRRTSPAERYYIPPEGGALNLSGRRQSVPDRTLGAQGQRPGGAINPRPRKRASTFGNTGKHRPGPDRAIGAFTESL